MLLTVGKNVKAGLLCAALLISLPLTAATRSKTASPRKSSSKVSTPAHGTASSRKHGTATNASQATTRATAHPGHLKGKLAKVAGKPKPRGQQAIDSERTMEIQQALVREHYLNAEPSGEWDQATRDALMRFQGDNHWQTKVLPDSRALIKLGLGPSRENLLNPESAAIAPSRSSIDEKPAPAATN
jgi:hypothetical protein